MMLTYHISHKKIFSTALYVPGRSGVNVLNFENLVIQRISLLMFKYSHGDVPVSVSQLFRTHNEYHNYNTRNCARIHAPVGTTEASYRTFGYRGIHIWNQYKYIISLL